MSGPMVADTRANGKRTSYTIEAFTRGQTVESTTVNTTKIKSTAWAFTFGLMVRSTKATGTTENSTDKADSQTRVERVASVCG